jgi:Family of unknown function (DUF5362)
MESSQSSIFDLQIDEQSRLHLLETAKWGKLLAIVGIISGGLIALVGLMFMVAGPIFSGMESMRAFSGAIGIVYLVIGVVWLFPSFKLLRFSSNMPAGINKSDQLLVTEAFANLKSCFKVWGIMTLVLIIFYALAMVAVMVVGAFS